MKRFLIRYPAEALGLVMLLLGAALLVVSFTAAALR